MKFGQSIKGKNLSRTKLIRSNSYSLNSFWKDFVLRGS